MHPEVQSPVTGRRRGVTRSRRDLRHRQGGVFLLRQRSTGLTLMPRSIQRVVMERFAVIAPLAPAISPPHSHRADEIAAAPPERLAGSGLLAVHAVFLGLSALFCSRAFLLTDLDSHAILGGDPA